MGPTIAQRGRRNLDLDFILSASARHYGSEHFVLLAYAGDLRFRLNPDRTWTVYTVGGPPGKIFLIVETGTDIERLCAVYNNMMP